MDIKNLTEKYKILIFDFDETLVRLNADWRVQVNHLKELYPEVVSAYPDTVGRSDVNYITVRNAIVDHYGDKVVKELHEVTEKLELRELQSVDYNRELINFVSEMCGIKKMYIWSGNCTQIITNILTELNIYNCFEKLVTQESVKYLKPYPEGFTHIYVDGTPKSDYVLIGDSINDESASKSANIDFIKIDFFKK